MDAALHALVDELLGFLGAACCAGCEAVGVRLCSDCARLLQARPRRRVTPEGLPVVAALPYVGVPARCIRRLKEQGQTHLLGPLGAAVSGARAATRQLIDGPAGTAVVPVPTGRAAFRRRGYRVPDMLARQSGAPVQRVLAPARATVDQRGLGRDERRRNVAGSMRVRRAGTSSVLLLDDVVTTGATLDEAARVLRAAGYRVRGAVALAATDRRSDPMADTSVSEGDF